MVYSGRIEELETNRFSLGSLRGKLMFVDDDVRTGIRLPDGTLKKISEEKELTGEQKYQNQFNFVSRAVPVLLCNNIPSLPDLSHGMLRRLQVLQFKRTFKGSKDDKGLFTRIWSSEMSGVLNRAIEGWRGLTSQSRDGRCGCCPNPGHVGCLIAKGQPDCWNRVPQVRAYHLKSSLRRLR
ncbi:MAG: hypothetical protein HQL42_17865 [Alphaproteobacteria bacterium]|nr:hypothetical protein [Alphaproteobacteria bacterium]